MATGEGENELMARFDSFLRIDRKNRRIEEGMLIPLTEKYDAQEGHAGYGYQKANSGYRISNFGVYRSPGSLPVEDGDLLLLLGVAAGSVGNFSYRESLTPLRLIGSAR